jgi:hypothetical protein
VNMKAMFSTLVSFMMHLLGADRPRMNKVCSAGMEILSPAHIDFIRFF